MRLCKGWHNRKNWLFAGSLRAGQRALAIMSLIQSARLNGHEPFAHLKDVLEQLPSQPYSRIGELLPHAGSRPPAPEQTGKAGLPGAYSQATFLVGLAPREDLVGVDVMQACEPRHGGARLQGLLDDGALELDRVAAVRPALAAMRAA